MSLKGVNCWVRSFMGSWTPKLCALSEEEQNLLSQPGQLLRVDYSPRLGWIIHPMWGGFASIQPPVIPLDSHQGEAMGLRFIKQHLQRRLNTNPVLFCLLAELS